MEKFLNGLEYEILKDVVKEEEYTGIEYDSRKIKTGNIFVAFADSGGVFRY